MELHPNHLRGSCHPHPQPADAQDREGLDTDAAVPSAAEPGARRAQPGGGTPEVMLSSLHLSVTPCLVGFPSFLTYLFLLKSLQSILACS